MVFSEPTFLFFFLPVCILGYLALRGFWRNHFLLIASLIFYTWAVPRHLPVLLASITLNYVFGLLIAANMARGGNGRLLTGLGIAANVGLLAWFKYLGFILDNLGVPNAYALAPELPIGISFFTFQALSYLIDLQARKVHVQRDPLRFALFKAMFPQLIAGPIVRYSEVEGDLGKRKTQPEDISIGMQRFVKGLAKKTLIADPMGLLADQIFAIPDGGLSPETAWIGALAYMLQIYFDFSAYSDMAIGLGRVFGFHFPENFNHPYMSRSVTEFWRRWHMTLSRWFRDYLYIPLGGNRHGAGRTYLNLSIVFLATGLWHGAAWTFVFWGVWHGLLLIMERMFLKNWLDKTPAIVSHVYLLAMVLIGWVAFRAHDFDQAGQFYSAMIFGTSGAQAALYPLARYFDGYMLTVMLVGAAFSAPLSSWLIDRARTTLPETGQVALRLGTLSLLFAVSLVSVGAASYSPFIYFRF